MLYKKLIDESARARSLEGMRIIIWHSCAYWTSIFTAECPELAELEVRTGSTDGPLLLVYSRGTRVLYNTASGEKHGKLAHHTSTQRTLHRIVSPLPHNGLYQHRVKQYPTLLVSIVDSLNL